MARIGLVLLLTTYLSLKGVTASPVEDVSYIEGLNFQYENYKWICGDVDCPANTFGCKIYIKTSEENTKVIRQSFTCIDKDKKGIIAAGDIIEISKEKLIDIDLETYVGAVSVYSCGYGLGGNEDAKGVVAVDELNQLKETARLQKKSIEDSNA